MPIIKVENLRKHFKRQKRKKGFRGALESLFSRKYEIIKAVESISFEIEKGEIIGYIGPNGAGKSTTIKMLVGILVPTSGSVLVNGLVPHENRIENARRMGVVFGQRTQLWWDIPVSESFNLIRHMYDIPGSQYRDNLKLFSRVLGIDEFINAPVRQLSLGQKMRADLCMAFLHNPDILYLDEPTIGLDVVVKENVREFIRNINQDRGTTIILATHDMSDIEKLSSRVMVIDHGRIMYDGSLNKLKTEYGSEELLTVEAQSSISGINELKSFDLIECETDENRLTVKYDRRKTSSSVILKWLMDRNEIKDFLVKETEIEEVIRKMYRSSNEQSE